MEKCREKGMGFLAMKALSGGLITNSAAAYVYLDQFDHVLPIWGVQREKELDEFLEYVVCPPKMTPELEALIEKDKRSCPEISAAAADTVCRVRRELRSIPARG